jgi:polyphosphate kinase
VIGRFLEHSRIFYFHAEGEQKLYLSSADWMERNFFRRVETCFPLLDPKLKRRVIKEGLRPYLADNSQAWDMDSEGEFAICPSRRARISAQELLLAELATRADDIQTQL